jgi:hypothetical protein
MSNEICITEYETEIEGGADYFCSLLIEDFDGDKKKAYEYAESRQIWEEVPSIIIGDPDESVATAELYFAVMEATKKQFRLILLGTY